MSVVDGVRPILRHGRSVVGGLGLGTAMNLGFAYFDYRSRIAQGQNAVVAGAFAAGNAYLATTMGFLPYLAVTAGYGLAKGGVQAYHNYYQSYSAYTRAMRMPFSHSFTHTDATYQAQQRGLQSLGYARGAIGSEAGMMAQLYARR